MNQEMVDLAVCFVEYHNCIAELWKNDSGYSQLSLENFDSLGYSVIISEVEPNDLGEQFILEYHFNFGDDRNKLVKARFLSVKSMQDYINEKVREFQKSSRDKLTGEYVLISEIKEDGRKVVVETIPMKHGDKISSVDVARIKLKISYEKDENKKYTYDIVNLGVGKHEE